MNCLSRFGISWRLVSRLNNNELSSRDSVLLKDTLETNVSSQREWTGGLLAMGCSHAVRSAVSLCIQSGCTPKPQVARKNTVIWTNGQLETGTACFESTSYENMVKNDTRCYGAHLFSRDNGIKGYQRSSHHQDGESECYIRNLMFKKDTNTYRLSIHWKLLWSYLMHLLDLHMSFALWMVLLSSCIAQ